MKITADMLRAAGGCGNIISKFEAAWPDGAEVTEDNYNRAVELGFAVNLDWAAERLLPQPARAEYEKVRDPAWAEYMKVRNRARAEYEKVRGRSWAEYVKVRDPAWAEYVKVRGRAFFAAWKKMEDDDGTA